ncbi:hypothetical protein [Actinomadura sp. 21ATH]|uniref:hypothetical protein n=1 Tax=Actinomadura sp. 21ATH TaxID=1735444 RepID=UPI0035BF525E
MSTQIEIREWQPGDGLACSWANRAPSRIPCGPPVAVQVNRVHSGTQFEKAYRRVVCALHLPGSVQPGEVMVDAEKAARERLAVAHWDEYQALIAEEISRRVEEAYSFASEELRRIATGQEAS